LGAVPAGAPVGVVGAGTMGAGIALVAARAGHPVRLVDVRPGASEQAVQRLRRRLGSLAGRGRLPDDEARTASARLTAVGATTDLAGCAAVVEAVAEDLPVKRALFDDLEAVVGERCLLATNTSSLSVTAVANGLLRPERVVGLHFFNPADRMRLVEVVRGDATAPATVEAAVELVRAWDKTPVVCASTPGFVVNRVARPFYGESQRLVEERVADPATVDAVLREAGGFPMGPFELTDLVGQDVNLAVSRSVWEQTFHDPRYAPTVFQQRLVDAGRLGRKNGRGVYTWDDKGRPTDATPATEPLRPAPGRVVLQTFEGRTGFDVMGPLLDRMEAGGVVLNRTEVRERDGELPTPGIRLPGGGHLCETYGPAPSACYAADGGPVVLLDWAHNPAACTRVALSPSADCPAESLTAAVGLCQAAGVAASVVGESPGGIVARTVSMLVNEAVELVGRGEATAEDVDVAMILGTGYPSGPLEWAERPGVDAPFILGRLHEAFPTGRYRPSALFERAERAGRLLREL
jgi:3-hydroxybutyryl-CoA dehydrogenase